MFFAACRIGHYTSTRIEGKGFRHPARLTFDYRQGNLPPIRSAWDSTKVGFSALREFADHLPINIRHINP